MYCNNCGKHNPADSNFCKSCGAELKKMTSEHKPAPAEHSTTTAHEKNHKHKKDENVKGGLSGWLALVGLGLIITPIIQGYGLISYIPLFNQTYDIPGYMTLLQLEFVASLIIVAGSLYLLYLYFKKNVNFPKYYIIFLIATAVYTVIDHMLLGSLTAPTPEQQKVITDTLSENSSEVARAVFFAIVWSAYMLNSKKVKATFVNEK